MFVVKPKNLAPVDKELWMTQQEYNIGKPGGDAIGVTIGDMAHVGVPGPFALVYLVFNTLFNLVTAEAQQRCFTSVATRLRPGGAFVVEVFAPDHDASPSGGGLTTSSVATDRVVLQATMADRASQTISGSTIEIVESGIRLRPWRIRWATTEQLDQMAAAAGLVVRHRWAGWDRSPQVADGARRVTVYERPRA